MESFFSHNQLRFKAGRVVRIRKQQFRVLVWHARNHLTIMNELWELARRISIFFTLKKFTVSRQKVLNNALCNFRLTLSMIFLYRKMRHRCVWILLKDNFLQNRSFNCGCPWDRDERRLSLRDDLKSHFKENCTVLFQKNKTVEIFFGRFRFWKTLVCGLLCVKMQTAWQRWVWFLQKKTY